jgi:hypothetical protein
LAHTDAVTVFDINSGVKNHGSHCMKFCKRRNPTGPLFSGWN